MMNCKSLQHELYEYLGEPQLPQRLEEHLGGCEECRTLWNELLSLSNHLGVDELFYPEPADTDSLAARVDRALDVRDTPRRRPVYSLTKYLVPMAASVILLFGISKFAGWINHTETSRGIDTVYCYVGDAAAEDFDESTINVLLQDFADHPSVEASEWLLDDLTEEELEYLKENIDVGELL